jgi:addiction module HigA family antidote
MHQRQRPTLPGQILKEEFLKPRKLTQKQLAHHLDCDIKVINRIINGRCAVSAEMAVKLAAALGTTADFWMNAQQAVDIDKAMRSIEILPIQLAWTSEQSA